jgi:hypothetical protein
MSEVMAVGEALARPPRSLDETVPPYPAAWSDPEAIAPGADEDDATPRRGSPTQCRRRSDAGGARGRLVAGRRRPGGRGGLAAAPSTGRRRREPDGEEDRRARSRRAVPPASHRGRAGAALPPGRRLLGARRRVRIDLAGPLLLGAGRGLRRFRGGRRRRHQRRCVAGLLAWMALSIPGWRDAATRRASASSGCASAISTAPGDRRRSRHAALRRLPRRRPDARSSASSSSA